MSFLLLEFHSGFIRPMLATRTRPSNFGKFADEAVHRCRDMNETAKVLDKESLTVLGEVRQTADGYVYEAKEPVT